MADSARFTFGSLFAGIGGFDLGLERAGMTCKWQVEIDPFCNQVLAKHWPDVPRYGDVRDVGRHNLKPVDLICGGFPCQPHSHAGKRRGAADDRNLWPEYRRVVAELRPRYVLAENVLGIRTTILDQVLSDLESLAYTVGALVVPACAFDAPHRRERVFIVAYASGENGRYISSIDTIQGTLQTSKWAEGILATYRGSQDVADAQYQRFARPSEMPQQTGRQCVEGANWWAVEPDVGRVANGVPQRVDRLRALGNAVVPQVAEWLGRQILAVEANNGR